MRKSSIALAGVGLAAGMMLAALPAKAAPAPPWHVSYRSLSATQSRLLAVSADSKTDAWAAGTTGTGSKAHSLIMHWTKNKWTTVSTSRFPSFSPVSVSATAPSNVWFFGWGDSGPEALVYNGSTLTARTLPYGFDTGNVAMLGPNNIWGIGSNTCDNHNLTTCTTTAWHWNGVTWSSFSLAGLVNQATGNRAHVWFLSLTKINTGNYGKGVPTGLPVMYEWASGALRKVSSPTARIMDVDNQSMAAAPNGQLWIFASLESGKHPAVFLHWTGSKWTQASVPNDMCPPGYGIDCEMTYISPIAFDGKSGVWVGPAAHWTGSAWVNTSVGPYITKVFGTGEGISPSDIAPIPGTQNIWLAGSATPKPNSNAWDAAILAYGAIP